MNCSQMDDDALLRLIIRAEADALDELYSRYGRLVFSIALHMVAERETAEEIALDVFTKVWQKADTYRPTRGSVRTWLSGMTRNRSIDTLRRERVRLDARSLSWSEVWPQPEANEHSPETAVGLSLRKQRIRAALFQLPEEQRLVLALAYFGGYTQREIAELCDLPLGTVKTRIRLAIQKLRQLLEAEKFVSE